MASESSYDGTDNFHRVNNRINRSKANREGMLETMNNKSYLQEAKVDLYRVLNAPSVTIAEVEFLLSEIEAGNMHGMNYLAFAQNSNCPVCIIGVFAKLRGLTMERYFEVDDVASSDWLVSQLNINVHPFTPIERYFAPVRPGRTPATSEPLANISAWIKEWLTEHLPAEAAADGQGEPIAAS